MFQSTPDNYAGRIDFPQGGEDAFRGRFNPLPTIMPGESRQPGGHCCLVLVSIHSRQLCRENHSEHLLCRRIQQVSIHSRQLCRENHQSMYLNAMIACVSIHSRQLCRENPGHPDTTYTVTMFQSTPDNYAGRISPL